MTHGIIEEIEVGLTDPGTHRPSVPARPFAGTKVYGKGARGVWWRPIHAPESASYGAGTQSDEVEPKDVLVVEDEAYLCDLIADVLEAEGHTTRKAANGREALAMVQTRRPQLILLDLMMPVMDGWEFMNVLRSRPEWAGIPVIIVTAIYDAKRTQAETGARAVLTKPFDIDHLTELVNIYSA